MIKYRRLYESEDSDIRLYDVVKCGGQDWFVINVEGDIVTLLAKNADFGRCEFDEKSNDYKTSKIRNYLKYVVLPELQSADPIPTRLNDVGVTDKVWLLSVDEAEKLPREIRGFKGLWYWLRSPGSSSIAASVAYDVGISTDGFHVDSNSGCVRPAMRVHIEDLD